MFSTSINNESSTAKNQKKFVINKNHHKRNSSSNLGGSAISIGTNLIDSYADGYRLDDFCFK